MVRIDRMDVSGAKRAKLHCRYVLAKLTGDVGSEAFSICQPGGMAHKSIADIDVLIAENGRTASLLSLRAQSHTKLGRYQEADNELDAALTIEPNFIRARAACTTRATLRRLGPFGLQSLTRCRIFALATSRN